ncbi:hypothetical protein ACFX13_038373 [Malus domestica]|uniref:deoxypodophyllotoxin synthase-like n=1 Tax=Malus domestica TaxID=3750 RepID=UPI003975EDE0
MAKLAIVDFSNEDCFKPGTSSWLSIRKDICHALEELGCFVAILPNKISSELCSTFFRMLDELFDFPTEIKVKNSYEKPYPTGYLNVGNTGYESLAIADAGLRSHRDRDFSTILCQNHVKGLEIYSKDDEWICFDPLPSSFVFLAGDGLQVWSNDRIRACKHQVTLSENDVRYSLGLFSFRAGETHTPKELIDEDHPLQYNPLNNLEYIEYTKKNYSSLGPDYTVKAYCGV